jgi:hypothetical protein
LDCSRQRNGGPNPFGSGVVAEEISFNIAPSWCKVVHTRRGTLVARRAENEPSTRTSVTFPAVIYSSLEIIAKQKKVSMAWVIRDAAEKYVSEYWPLFAGARHE